MTPNVSAPAPDAVVRGFAERVAARDLPPPLPADFFAPAAVQARVAAALAERLAPVPRAPRRRHLAQALYAFMHTPSLDLYALMDAVGTGRQAATQHVRLLLGAGLLASAPAGLRLRYALTRAGEDWLLAVVDPRGLTRPATEAPPAA